MKYSQKQILHIGLGGLLIAMNLLFSSSSSSLENVELSSLESSTEEAYFANPELSFWEEMICTGYQTAWLCPKGPLHPYSEYDRVNGKYKSTSKKPKRVSTFRYEGA